MIPGQPKFDRLRRNRTNLKKKNEAVLVVEMQDDEVQYPAAVEGK